MKNGKVQIAVIDTYVDIRSEVFSNISIHFSSFASEKLNEKVDVGHGTAVCAILVKVCCDVELTVFPIFKNAQEGEMICSVVKCLEYIYNNNHFDIINLSLGVAIPYPDELCRLRSICNKITQDGTIIVSAFDNAGGMSYPAAFDNVIGVDISSDVKSHLEYEYVQNSPINIRGCALPQRVIWGEKKHLLVRGSSFIAPYVSGIIANIIINGATTVEAIMQSLCKGAIGKKVMYNSDFVRPSFKSDKAVAFPFNKEIHSVVAFSNFLSFDLVAVYDIKHTMHVNRKASEIIGLQLAKDYVVQNIDMLDWESDFDTLILGHIGEIVRILGELFIRKIVRNCQKYGKQIYAFDNSVLKYLDNNNQHKIFYPYVDEKHYPKKNLGKMWHITTPILAVLGTRSKQGKFTIQQLIRYRLSSLGYHVGYLATEPSGFLFQAQEVFPFGYNTTVNLPAEKMVPIVNEMLHQIDMQQFDVIITGGQSGVIPYNYYNIKSILLAQAAYLYGVNPDVVVLCICADDDIDYIKRTISFIESSCNTDVVAAMLFPYADKPSASGQFGRVDLRKTQQGYYNTASSLSMQLNIPVFTHEEDDIAKCVETVVNFLGEG